MYECMRAASMRRRRIAGNEYVKTTSSGTKVLNKIPAAPLKSSPSHEDRWKSSQKTIFPFTKFSSKRFWYLNMEVLYLSMMFGAFPA